MCKRFVVFVTATLTIVAASASIVSAQGRGRVQQRFKAMDLNRDGVITRDEWRGSSQSFQKQDWNRDGRLSGNELRVGGRRGGANRKGNEFDSPSREYQLDDWTARGFTNLDHNRDGRITDDEWHFDREAFRRVDHNGDGVMTRSEFLNEDRQDDDRDDRFRYDDLDGDRRVSLLEWHGSRDRFDALDRNRDGFLAPAEMLPMEPPTDFFTSVDVNRDGSIGRDEWHWTAQRFNGRDLNRDGRLTRKEFTGSAAPASRPAAYRAGQERGLGEGHAAGREDRVRNQGWDLEGQRELETADSGYQPEMGPKAEYQAGYREAFRRAYREGWERS